MLYHFWPVTQSDVRESCWDGHCCYCGEQLGGEHRPQCAIRQRTVVVEIDKELQLIAWFPEAWTLDMVAEYFNGGLDHEFAILMPGLDNHQPASQCLVVTSVREATNEDEESLPEWPT